jgi:hypothetical protein
MRLILIILLLNGCSYFKETRQLARAEVNSFNLPSLQTESQLSCEFVCTNNKDWKYDNHRWFEGKLICKCVKDNLWSYFYFKAEQPIQIEIRRY